EHVSIVQRLLFHEIEICKVGESTKLLSVLKGAPHIVSYVQELYIGNGFDTPDLVSIIFLVPAVHTLALHYPTQSQWPPTPHIIHARDLYIAFPGLPDMLKHALHARFQTVTTLFFTGITELPMWHLMMCRNLKNLKINCGGQMGQVEEPGMPLDMDDQQRCQLERLSVTDVTFLQPNPDAMPPFVLPIHTAFHPLKSLVLMWAPLSIFLRQFRGLQASLENLELECSIASVDMRDTISCFMYFPYLRSIVIHGVISEVEEDTFWTLRMLVSLIGGDGNHALQTVQVHYMTRFVTEVEALVSHSLWQTVAAKLSHPQFRWLQSITVEIQQMIIGAEQVLSPDGRIQLCSVLLEELTAVAATQAAVEVYIDRYTREPFVERWMDR
ncbi:hypothetical protein DXG01_011737, partial [Tephrocybe rancida]